MTPYTDEMMKARLGLARTYTLLILRRTEKLNQEGARAVVWEHGRRNMELQAAGLMPIVLPIADHREWAGLAVFVGTPDEVRKIMEDDPGVRAGLFTYEVTVCRGFPGSTLP